MTGDRRRNRAVSCHQTPRNSAFSRRKAHTSRSDPESAMTQPATGREPELLTITEAAELVRAPVATLRYWRHLGIGPHSSGWARRVLSRRDAPHDWIAQQRAEPLDRR